MHAAQETNRVADLEAQRAQLQRFWHYFKRRALEQRIATAVAGAVSANSQLTEARAAAQGLEQEPVPEFPGLSVEARRAINLAAIAYAEVLCLRLSGSRIVALAREATARREVADEYGSPPECAQHMKEIAQALALIQVRASVTEITARVERLRQVARYRSPTDTSPLAESTSFAEGDVLTASPRGAATAHLPNVLAEDIFDLFRVLLR